MKRGIQILAVILFLLGTVSILAGIGVINITPSVHHLRYELGGALVDLIAISGLILITVKDVKAKLRRVATFFRFDYFREREFNRSEAVWIGLFLGLLGITAFGLVLWVTPYGAGVNPDSIVYIGSAKSLLSGQGYSTNGLPETHFPPLYSLFLAATNLLANNFVQAARILNAILYGINAGLIALAVYLTTGRKFLTTLCAGLFFFSSTRLLELHAGAYSEPLFISLSLASILFLRLYVFKPGLAYLIAASLFLGFACITRYIGIAFLPAVLVVVFFSGSERTFARKFRDVLLCLILSCAPLVFFLVRNVLVAGSATDRSFIPHTMPILQYVTNLWGLVINFVMPLSLPIKISLAIWGGISVILIVQIILLFRESFKDIRWHWMDIMMPVSCLLFSAFYLLFLYISISFMDASTPVDTRLLSPILCISIVGVFSAVWTLSKKLRAPLAWGVFLFLVVLSISFRTPDAIHSAAVIQENGLAYTSPLWQNSKTMAYVKKLPDNVEIYTNGPDIVSFLADKKPISLPDKTFPVTRQANSLYTEQIDSMCKLIVDKRAVLVYFNLITGRWYLPTQAEVASNCKLPVLRTFGDGIVYGDIPK